MKKRRVSREELKKMSHMVIVWRYCEPRDYIWATCKFMTMTDNGVVLAHEGESWTEANYNLSSSLEEVMLKASIAYPGESVYEIDEHGMFEQTFQVPCGYDITGETIEVYEISI